MISHRGVNDTLLLASLHLYSQATRARLSENLNSARSRSSRAQARVVERVEFEYCDT